MCETVNGPDKAEVIHPRGPPKSFEPADAATLEWVNWFTSRHLLEPIGNVPPAETELGHYAADEPTAMAA